ncbi:hypothetical protein [Dyella flagellata]|uniref:Uncharacterized protein n=1 Tax=Dyella flagellata TaxID=1867833 RepID=A0ABQ5XHB3_9GAMM|nr:hypothetical protein [Dyella flagellata]GLQ89923.1 hypothetical protein GCM10007898_34980 [Dyella flagellata]
MATTSPIYTRGSISLPDCNSTPMCDTTPACPACGGLECLCRPRFFAGQLLTDEDLNRLDHYIVAKNRLHNRYLVGTGVACGLEVVCDGCATQRGSGKVTVKPGYAVSPCGNDIVVCNNVTVDVCALIAQCRPQTDSDCSDLFAEKNTATLTENQCDAGSEDWVLAICYTEKPSRGVGALHESANGPSCSCGGSGGSGGCSCGGTTSSTNSCGCQSSSANKSATTTPKRTSVSCEPTLICEGYSFKAYKIPRNALNQRSYGALMKRYLCCIKPMLDELQGSFGDNRFAEEQLYGKLSSLRDALAEFIQEQGFYDCELAARLGAVGIPAPLTGANGNETNWQKQADSYAYAMNGLSKVAAEIKQKCLCAALLPPCPAQAMADCVPLATITVSTGTCRVSKVCNVSVRDFLPTWPNIQYWLSAFSTRYGSLFDMLHRYLELMCCNTRSWGHGVNIKYEQNGYVMSAQPATAKLDEVNNTPPAFATLLSDALAHPEHRIDSQSLFLATLGLHDAYDKPLLSDEEMSHPTEALLISQVIAPWLRDLSPKPAQNGTTASNEAVNVNDLASQIDALKKQVADQQAQIAKLSSNTKP